MQGAAPTLLYDASGAPVSSAWSPVTSRPGQATYAPQAGIVGLGLDYSTSATAGVAYAPKVDDLGNQYHATVTAAGVPVNVVGNQVLASTAVASGPVMMGLTGLTATPATMDGVGNLLAAPVQLPTFVVLAKAVTLATGISVLSLMNSSTAGKVLRLARVFSQNTSTSDATLTTYQLFAMELRPITGVSGGTALTPLAYDSADALDANVKAYTGTTVSGQGTTPYRRWVQSDEGWSPGGTAAEGTTADQQGRDPWVERSDYSAKLITLRPGQGVSAYVASTANQGVVDMTFIFTQASA